MMIQEIITYLILTTVLAIMLYKLVQFIRKPADNSPCNNCSEKNHTCSLEKLKKEMAENRVPPRKS